MKVIDLSQELYHQMPVYPGDPEVMIEQVHTLKVEGWDLRTLFLTTHLGTHVNVPVHMVENGKTLSDMNLESFMGQCVTYSEKKEINPTQGLIFVDTNITSNISEKLKKVRPKFVGLSAEFEFDIVIEKELLEEGIISFENLVNVDQLPTDTEFDFYGVPLKIKDGDGSPVRAFAVVK